MFQNMTKLMYKSKSVALMPDITDDDEPAETRSPFLTPRRKASSRLIQAMQKEASAQVKCCLRVICSQQRPRSACVFT